MPAHPATIRALTRAELGTALDWAAAEGWNPGLHDAGPFHAADPEGFFGAFLDGELIGSLSAVRYGESLGFIGLYIVKPERRGQGYGMQLWQRALEHLAGRAIGLDGVVERQADYARSGFALAYRNVRYQGAAPAAGLMASGIVPLAELPFEALLRYDAQQFPAPRERFLKAWIAQPESRALGLMGADGLAGYGVIRRCRSGWKIGPLFADQAEYAEALFLALCGHAAAGDPIFLDLPEPHHAAVALAERHGMRVVFETARMYSGPPPALPLDATYGITTYELG
jgi:hypothetical protein